MKRTRTNWTKKATILLAAVCVALAAAAAFTPPGAQEWLLQVEGAPVSRAVYSYFLAQAIRDAKQAGRLKADGSPKDLAALRKDVTARCVEYIAIGSTLREMEVPVDQVLKSQVADQTASYWRVFGRYYKSIGVSKQTLSAVLTGQAARDQLFRALYDAGGTKGTAEETIESYFYGNYLAYEGIRVFRKVMEEDGTEREMDISEAAALRQTLQDFVQEANDSEDFYGAAQEEKFAEALSYGTPTVTWMRTGTAEFSEEDFKLLRALKPSEVVLLSLPGYFLVARGINMRESPEEHYLRYRADCLWKLKGALFEKELKAICGAYRADENVGAMEKFYGEWKW
ncbi:MAG: hypothetical protein FWC27_07220 [Firmicutes bacterium]|nr:hypothetical protein [Bacillota bacterium]